MDKIKQNHFLLSRCFRLNTIVIFTTPNDEFGYGVRYYNDKKRVNSTWKNVFDIFFFCLLFFCLRAISKNYYSSTIKMHTW